MKNIVIVGGGTAGCISSLLLKNKLQDANVIMVASKSIGILGPGEGLTPNIHRVLNDLSIDHKTFIKETKGTIKNGIKFTGWSEEESWFHGFYDLISDKKNIFEDKNVFFDIYKYCVSNNKNLDEINYSSVISDSNKVLISDDNNYSFHIDSRLMVNFFEKECIARGINIIDGIVKDFISDSNNKITSLIMEDGSTINCDFVVDCTGFKRKIIGEFYNSKWVSVKKYLPATDAIACKLSISKIIPPYTEAIAMDYGWSWKIPLQHRYGCGYVYDKRYISKDQAEAEMIKKFGNDLEILGNFSFDPGYFENIWIENCLAIGLSSQFFEPLEATAIETSIGTLFMFIDYYLDDYINGKISNNGMNSKISFNKIIKTRNEAIVSFLYLHYYTNKKNTSFWKNFKNDHPAPKFLIHDVKNFIENMKTGQIDNQISTTPSWPLSSWLSVYAGNKIGGNFNYVMNEDKYQKYIKIVKEKSLGFVDHEEYLKNSNM
jgi:tryptophan halogenase